MGHSIVVADRDTRLCETIAGELCADGYRAVGASAIGALALCLANHQPDLVVLGDYDGPGSSARLLRSLRGGEEPFAPVDSAVAVIVLTGEAGQLALLRCFDAGADDHLPKPASYLELRARIRAVLARTTAPRRSPVQRVGALELDPARRRAAYAGRELALSRIEWRLLFQLAGEPGRVYSKAELLREVWGHQEPARTRTVDAHACRLRRKLDHAGAGDAIANCRGVGYALTTGQTGPDTA